MGAQTSGKPTPKGTPPSPPRTRPRRPYRGRPSSGWDEKTGTWRKKS